MTGTVRPLEMTRAEWFTSDNLKQYFEVAAQVLIDAGVVVANRRYEAGTPYSEPLVIIHPKRICSYDETRVELDCTKGGKGKVDRIVRGGMDDDGSCLATKSNNTATTACGRTGDGKPLPPYIIFSSGSFSLWGRPGSATGAEAMEMRKELEEGKRRKEEDEAVKRDDHEAKKRKTVASLVSRGSELLETIIREGPNLIPRLNVLDLQSLLQNANPQASVPKGNKVELVRLVQDLDTVANAIRQHATQLAASTQLAGVAASTVAVATTVAQVAPLAFLPALAPLGQVVLPAFRVPGNDKDPKSDDRLNTL